MLLISFDLCACVSSINKFFINSVQQTTGDVFSLVLISYPDNLWFVASQQDLASFREFSVSYVAAVTKFMVLPELFFYQYNIKKYVSSKYY